jgi:hypothetical protein
MKLSRRQILKVFAAGGIVVAGEILLPSNKLISIPSGKVFGNEYGINSTFRMIDRHTVAYVGAEDKVVSIKEFTAWLKKNAAYMLNPHRDEDDMFVTLRDQYRITNPEHLMQGTLSQAAADQHCTELREIWTCTTGMDGEDLFTDKIYYSKWDDPRQRITITDTGHKGFR